MNLTVSSHLICYFCRGFNDAVNGFNDDGWSILNCDSAEDVVIAVNSTKNLSATCIPASSLTFPGGVICAKASMLLQVSLKMAWIFSLFLGQGLSFIDSLFSFLDSVFNKIKDKEHVFCVGIGRLCFT